MIGCFVKHEHHGVGKILSIKGRTVAIGFYEPPIKQNYSINALQEGIIKHYLLPLGTICKVSTGEGKIIDIIRDPEKKPFQSENQYRIELNNKSVEKKNLSRYFIIFGLLYKNIMNWLGVCLRKKAD